MQNDEMKRTPAFDPETWHECLLAGIEILALSLAGLLLKRGMIIKLTFIECILYASSGPRTVHVLVYLVLPQLDEIGTAIISILQTSQVFAQRCIATKWWT